MDSLCFYFWCECWFGFWTQWAQINFSTLNQRWFNVEPQLSSTLIFGWEIVDFETMINQKSTSQPQFNQKSTKFEVEMSMLKNGWNLVDNWSIFGWIVIEKLIFGWSLFQNQRFLNQISTLILVEKLICAHREIEFGFHQHRKTQCEWLQWRTFLTIAYTGFSLVWILLWFFFFFFLMTLIWKGFRTYLTLVKFLFGVSSDVSRQLKSPCKTFLTIITLVWFLFGVCPHVRVQVRSLWKKYLTILTLVWFLCGVSSEVYRQVRSLWKTFLAMLALVWLFSGFSLVWVLMW